MTTLLAPAVQYAITRNNVTTINQKRQPPTYLAPRVEFAQLIEDDWLVYMDAGKQVLRLVLAEFEAKNIMDHAHHATATSAPTDAPKRKNTDAMIA